jgi:hypothetical protein
MELASIGQISRMGLVFKINFVSRVSRTIEGVHVHGLFAWNASFAFLKFVWFLLLVLKGNFFDSSLFDVFAVLIKSQVVWSLDMKRFIGTFFPMDTLPT